MNLSHFRAFVWLRWRLFVNQMRRGGVVNAVFMAIIAVGALLMAAAASVGAFLAGLFLLPAAPPAVLLYVWDGVVLVFLFGWTVGLLVELQRSEVLSLDKFLHLPVSLKSAFLINYFSSLVNLSLIVFVPVMAATILGLTFGKGPAMLVLFPLLAAFVLMVTALTYQFQGWLASLMANPRRRRTVIVLVTMAFILICQLPNLVNILQPWKGAEHADAAQMREGQAKLDQELAAKEITWSEFQDRRNQIRREIQARQDEADLRLLGRLEHSTVLVNTVLPPGWLPLGAMGAAEENFVPALLGCLGMASIGALSLWRAYRTTLRLYTGQYSSGKPAAVAVAVAAPAKAAPAANVIERRLPWLSEPAAAVALAGFRSLVRAPEAKMMLLSPLILVVVFGSLLFARGGTMPEAVRPLLAFAALLMTLFGLVQIVGNQFGFDRGGFRVFVLSAAPRRDILLGKNLAVAPLALVLALPIVALLQILSPMRLDYLLAVVPQAVLMYLLFCLTANWMSILAPMAIRAGSFKPANTKAAPILLQVAFALLAPLALAPALLPYGVDVAVSELGGARGLPICLVLSLLECAGVVLVYRLLLHGQGRLLQAREMRILELITAKAE